MGDRVFGDLAGEIGAGRLDRREVLAAAVGGGVALTGLTCLAMAAPGKGIAVSPEQLRPTYDDVIVGAGSAGCVVAHRLSRTGRRVLLIEVGGRLTCPSGPAGSRPGRATAPE